ncbi:GNAT family N-acetyltransferase [Streptomyces sp. B6B3]|uniref:GNAT family N-acetyltransferase n=1 Tax=Streptomyces sp. B6B3 TaxID=3153570 RepID=UPI00325E0823
MHLIERERELTTLRDLFTRSRGGRGQVVIISGAVASGKTALLRTFAEDARRAGAVLLDAAAAPAEQASPAALVRRLVRDAATLPGAGEDMLRLLDEGVGGTAFQTGEPPEDGGAQLAAPVLQGLCGMLLAVAAQVPLVIAVDDVQHADAASARFLLYLAYRVGAARILLVLGERSGLGEDRPPLHAELLGQPHCRRVGLAPLSPDAQAGMLAPHLDADARRSFGVASQALTAGNPLLVRALAQDHRGRPVPDALPAPSAAFARAVLDCLRRGEPTATPIAQALAVAGEAASPGFLARLLGLERQHVAQVLDALAATGLLVEGRIRHPAVRTVLVDGMAPAERAALHGRVARLLHRRGAAAGVVADHLLAAESAGAAGEPWVVPVLADAAGTAVAGAEPERAGTYLRLALAACRDARQRQRIEGELAGLGWRVAPTAGPLSSGAGPGRHERPAEASGSGGSGGSDGPVEPGGSDSPGGPGGTLGSGRPVEPDGPGGPDRPGSPGGPSAPGGAEAPGARGRGTGGDPLGALGRLLWFGPADATADGPRPGDTSRAPGTRARSGGLTTRFNEAATDREALKLLLSCLYPRLFPGAYPGAYPGPTPAGPPGWAVVECGDRVPDASGRPLRAAAALFAVLAGEHHANGGTPQAPWAWGRGDGVLDATEQVLQGTRIGESSLGGVLAALAALVYDDRLAEAARWCDPLLESAESRQSPVWHATLSAARGLISLRQGDLVAAEQQANEALARLSPASWGVGIGLPLSVLVLANTAMGRHRTAETHLAVPVPPAMFQTLCGPHYLHARGRHLLATGRPRAALEDLDACRRLLSHWQFDVPGLVAWHTDTALARLALGERAAATAVVDELLPTLRPGPSRTRGMALRVRARCVEGTERERLLRQAVDQLEQCGDRYELVLALADLGQAQHALGQHEAAFAAGRRAQRLRRHGFAAPDAADGVPSTAALGAAPGPPRAGGRDGGPAGAADDLTEAELRVAALAAHGQSNREIATTLLITVSTVEQHLTRVFRKLGVRGRAELRPELWTDPAALFRAGDAGQERPGAAPAHTGRVELRTERLSLRRWRESDLDSWATMNADRRVTEQPPGPSPGVGHGLWVIEPLSRPEFAGVVGLETAADGLPYSGVEIAWRLAPWAWGHGYATEAARAAVDFGFDKLGLAEIVAATTAANARSQAVMRRLGMTRDPADDFDHPWLPPGPHRPHVLYRLRP